MAGGRVSKDLYGQTATQREAMSCRDFCGCCALEKDRGRWIVSVLSVEKRAREAGGLMTPTTAMYRTITEDTSLDPHHALSRRRERAPC